MEYDSGNTAWVLVSAALVLFMTPGLALFYGGMVRAKNVLGMLMQNFFSMGLISVIWSVIGFSLAFGDGGKYIGNLDFLGLAAALFAVVERPMERRLATSQSWSRASLGPSGHG